MLSERGHANISQSLKQTENYLWNKSTTRYKKYLPKAEYRLKQISSHDGKNHPGSQNNPTF